MTSNTVSNDPDLELLVSQEIDDNTKAENTLEMGCNSKLVVLPAVMTEAEARQCIEEIKNLGQTLRAKLLDLELRQGWAVLDYPSMTACIKDQFTDAGSKSSLIREWNAGQMERELEVQICTYPAYQLRPLRKLKPEQRKSAFLEAQKLAGDSKLTANHVTQAVTEMLNPPQPIKQNQPPPYKPGELVRIQCRAGALSTQKVWNDCWGIVQSTGSISCVRVLVGSKEVEYMSGDLDWENNPGPKFRNTCERILNLWQQAELEPVEENLLKFLQRRRFFTDLEMQIVALMEAKRS
jgi:hypothetical protein